LFRQFCFACFVLLVLLCSFCFAGFVSFVSFRFDKLESELFRCSICMYECENGESRLEHN
jgi:hypothetical protein